MTENGLGLETGVIVARLDAHTNAQMDSARTKAAMFCVCLIHQMAWHQLTDQLMRVSQGQLTEKRTPALSCEALTSEKPACNV